MKNKLCFLFMASAFLLQAQEQKWPKLMQRFEGENVTVRYDNTKGFWYEDYKGNVIPGMTLNFDNSRSSYLYVDSSGTPISNITYEQAGPFVGGLAIVGTQRKMDNIPPQQFAVINEKSEYVFPLSVEPKFTIGFGLVSIEKKTGMEVYDRNAKKITSCNGCEVGTNTDMKHIIMNPRPYSKDSQVVRLISLDGKELLKAKGIRLWQISNDISSQKYTYSTLQPFYQLTYSEGQSLSSIVSSEGKVVMDSVNYSFFSRGKSCITKNGLAAVVDTNFKILMPYSFGYDFYRPLYYHPQAAYCARKNGVYRVIDSKNKQLVPMELTYTEIWYKPEKKLYEGRDNDGNFWYMSLNGDTVVSPVRYDDIQPMDPVLPGFLVRSKTNHKLGYMAETGKMTVPCNYDYLGYGGKNLFLFFKDSTAGFLDMNGQLKISKNGILKLSAFSGGYALCGVKVSDRSKFSESAQTVTDGQQTYQVQNKVMDSTGKFISEQTYDWINVYKNGYAAVISNNESFMVDLNMKRIVLPDNCELASYFYKGTALAYNPKKNTWGLVNDKLEIIVPVIYDEIDKREEENARYSYSVATANGYDYGGGYTNYYANIVDDKLTVTLKGIQQTLDLNKDGQNQK